MKCFYCLLLMLCPCINRAQPPALNSISPGDKVPDISFAQMLNYKSSTAKLSDFKGKLLILDFWATWCSACIRKLNMLDSMQRTYPNHLQVLLANAADTKDTRQKIEAFFNRYTTSTGNRLVLPTIYNDQTLRTLFPNDAIPLYCWVSPNQTCLAITGPDEMTAKNIEAVLNGQLPAFAGTSLMQDFDFTKPLFVQGNAGNGEGIRFRSTLSNYIPGLRSGSAHTTQTAGNLVTQYKLINTPLRQMITLAYRYFSRPDRIQLQVSDSIKAALFPITDSAKFVNSYTYEIICPPVPFNSLPVYIKQDIERWFGLSARYQKQPTACYALTVDTVLLGRYRSRGGKQTNHLNDNSNRYMQNAPLAELVSFLDQKLDKPVFQKDSIPFNLDLNLNLNLNPDLNLNLYLETIGIFLTPSTKMMEQFIIYQLPKQQTP